MNDDPLSTPNEKIIYPYDYDPDNYADFSRLTIPELRERWVQCEQDKMVCHPESGFQGLIDDEMRAIVKELKKRKRG